MNPREVAWICPDCARMSGAQDIPGHVCTMHYDPCGVCGIVQAVTEPRDFRWPRPISENNRPKVRKQ